MAPTFSDDAKNYIRLRKDGAIAFDRHLLLASSDWFTLVEANYDGAKFQRRL